MLYAFIGFGGLVFWVLVATWVVLELLAVENESAAGATVVLIAAAAMVMLFTDTPLAWIWQHPWSLFWIVVGYVVCGAAWGLGKWYFYCLDMRDEFSREKEKIVREWQRRENVGSFEEYVRSYYSHMLPNASRSKGLIMLWMAYWPFSALWTLINEPVKRIFRAVYEYLAKTYTRIADHTFAGKFDV